MQPTQPNDKSPQANQKATEDRAIRLQRFLSMAGVASRRDAEELIRAGRVTVNGVRAELGMKVNPETDRVEVDGKPVRLRTRHYYLALHKPPGYLSTLEDPQGRKTIVDLLPAALRAERLYPAGRLDNDSEGLMLLTTDGEWAHRVMHPSHGHEKEYLVLVSGRPERHALQRLEEGIELDGEKTAPAQIVVRRTDGRNTWLTVVLREGRKRQIRRMFEAIGHPVLRLIRQRIGPVRLGRLKPGQYRPLTPRERQVLRLLAEGRTNREIAQTLGIGTETAKQVVRQIFRKLGARRRADAVAAAYARGLL
ncbi:MAG: pseudouridine synthase [Chloroflexota bacterium]